MLASPPSVPHGPSRDDERPLLGGLSLEQKLPLILSGMLATMLAVTIAATYVVLGRRSEAVVRDRIEHAVVQIARGAEVSIDRRVAALRAVAADSAVVRALVPGAGARALSAARTAIGRLRGPRDTMLPVELWRGDARVAVVGDGRVAAALPDAVALPPRPDGVHVGALRVVGGQVRFWLAAPVRVDGDVVGWVTQARSVGGPREVTADLRELMREEVTVASRNADGSLWAAQDGTPIAAPVRRLATARGLVLTRADGAESIAAERAIGGTPWVVVLESPLAWVTGRPRESLLWLAPLGLALTILGALISFPLARRITRPLVALTAAAEALAGDERAPLALPLGRRDEIGRLARTFETMASRVAAARQELEGRVDEAQSAADGLALANWQLRETMAEAERSRADAERLRAEAEDANRAKSDFLAVMSHELRTPLNAISGYTQLLEMGLYGAVTAEQREALERIGRSQAHLLTLINDVLHFARIDARQMAYAITDVPVHETLAELEALVAPQVRSSRLTLAYHACDDALAVRADRDKLRQIVLNLLTNAIKYTPAGGAVVVSCQADASHVRVSVADTGTGIPAERLSRIFEPFVQAGRALNRPQDGVGLGLTISRDLARGMDGEIEVCSEVGRGSTFTLVLPRGAGRAPVAHPGGTPGTVARGEGVAARG